MILQACNATRRVSSVQHNDVIVCQREMELISENCATERFASMELTWLLFLRLILLLSFGKFLL